MREKSVERCFPRYFVFGRTPDGFADVSDGQRDVVTHIKLEEAEQLVEQRDRLIDALATSLRLVPVSLGQEFLRIAGLMELEKTLQVTRWTALLLRAKSDYEAVRDPNYQNEGQLHQDWMEERYQYSGDIMERSVMWLSECHTQLDKAVCELKG